MAESVRRLAPELFADGPISTIRVETTRPVFLLFGVDWRQPIGVAQIGSRTHLEPLHTALTTLHPRVPDLLPRSLACVPWHEEYLHLQTGLAGVPWFRVRDEFRTSSDWMKLQRRAGHALERLHRAIAESPGWRRRVVPAEELLLQIDRLIATGPGGSSHLVSAVRKQAQMLATLGAVEWFWQHGDYCVNNLLVGPDGVGIVDFEEFGATVVPLHDEISLGLSIHEFSSAETGWQHAALHVRASVEQTLLNRPELIPYLSPLVTHHLMWRINQCDTRPKRQAIRARLMTMLTELVVETGGRYFSDGGA
jgi:hypothetical protein